MSWTPASSSDLPSEATLTRVSESGTRFTHTAIFMGAERKRGRELLATADGFSELRTHAQLQMPRQSRREKPLHRRPRRERILRKRPEARVAPIEHVAHHAAQLEPLPLHQERRIGLRRSEEHTSELQSRLH